MKLKVYSHSTPLLLITILLCVMGLFILFSSALGKLSSVSVFTSIMTTQILGIALGFCFIAAAICVKKFDYRLLYKKKLALYIFISTIVLQLMVFSPLGISRKGATRWLDTGVLAIQPSEFLKIALVLFLASLLVGFKKEIKKFIPLSIVLSISVGVTFLLMLLIRDKGTLIIMGLAVFAMLITSRAKNKHIALMGILGVLALGGFVMFVSGEGYAKDRVLSFMGLTEAPQGQDYQINLAVATIGSGQLAGKGYGQSLQKHNFLPETLNDSIFAIFAEEWGFVGAVFLMLLFLLFLYYGLRIAQNAPDEYGVYVAVGLTTLIVSQAFFNMLAMVKLVPLSGMPLIFISKGGSAILSSLIMVAILLNISRFAKKK